MSIKVALKKFFELCFHLFLFLECLKDVTAQNFVKIKQSLEVPQSHLSLHSRHNIKYRKIASCFTSVKTKFCNSFCQRFSNWQVQASLRGGANISHSHLKIVKYAKVSLVMEVLD